MIKRKVKVYLASSFDLIPEVKLIAKMCDIFGFEITERWWERPYDVEGLGTIKTDELKKHYESLNWLDFYAKPETIKSYELDRKGVEGCDVLILIAGLPPRKFNGATYEAGLADGLEKHLLVWGELETSVMFSKFVRCLTLDGLISQLMIIQKDLNK